MAILDRVKERIETDLSDDEINSMISEAQGEIDQRFGPVGEPVTINLSGDKPTLDLIRPADPDETITVEEYGTALDPEDFELRNNGRTLARIGRRHFGRLIRVTYQPVDDSPQREEVTIKLVILGITYRGANKNVAVGDSSLTGSVTPTAHQDERESLLSALIPHKGLLIR